MRRVIGLAGVKTSGKSTAAEIIKTLVKADEAALADKLKNTCAKAFDLERIQFDAQELKEVDFGRPMMVTRNVLELILEEFNIPVDRADELRELEGSMLKSPRHIAQFVGTEILRSLDNPDIHCDNVNLFEFEDTTIISDMRFPNEYDYFANREDIDFIPLYVAREKAEAEVTTESHPSETSVFLFKDKCFRLDNNGTIDQLKTNITAVLKGKL